MKPTGYSNQRARPKVVDARPVAQIPSESAIILLFRVFTISLTSIKVASATIPAACEGTFASEETLDRHVRQVGLND